MATQPDRTVPDEPLTIVQRVYAKGEPLGGNICPPVRARPFLVAMQGSGVLQQPKACHLCPSARFGGKCVDICQDAGRQHMSFTCATVSLFALLWC